MSHRAAPPVETGLLKWQRETTRLANLPVQPDTSLILRSCSDASRSVTTKLLGVVKNNFLMIQKPEISADDRILGNDGDDFLCMLLHKGYEIRFVTRVRQYFPKDVIYIDYPKKFEVKSLREHYRINVDFQVDCSLEGFDEVFSGVMRNVSESGCRLALPRRINLRKTTQAWLTFRLPDGAAIANMRCSINNFKHFEAPEITELGVYFMEPGEEIVKIHGFCLSCISRMSVRAPRILIIDEDREYAGALAESLKEEGYEPCVSTDGKEGLKAIHDDSFDVVILELRLPGVSGIEILKTVKRSRGASPEVIILTSHWTTQAGIESLHFGAFDCLAKPIETCSLIFKIAEAYHRKIIREGVYVC